MFQTLTFFIRNHCTGEKIKPSRWRDETIVLDNETILLESENIVLGRCYHRGREDVVKQ